MNERKILLFILSVIIYCLYSVQMWFVKHNVEDKIEVKKPVVENNEVPPEIAQNTKRVIKTKAIPMFMHDACTVLETFTAKPEKTRDKRMEYLSTDNNSLTVFGITVFLIILTLNAILDVLKVKEEERAKRKLNPDGERRQSLAEFANKKTLRRESSKFGLQLFQIAESFVSDGEEKKNTRQSRPYKRGDSTNSYLSERKCVEGSAPASVGETSAEPRLVKRQSVAKLFGARPVPMVRRSSFPALPLNPEIQALMLGHKQTSFDSDDESDGKGRRVRIIRRY
ncbi:hypothetical protein K1T71_007952 [Dendrolimus kikuchii]|uniref:Uncharacterized protein n=1 Tax=Dendrolimus kikuchii TaxID=765133 RepID=A0ACC1CZM0_9NEOP|nr:hypothetical protein K1T71_007952 [Dendrolimus kikuchii]